MTHKNGPVGARECRHRGGRSQPSLTHMVLTASSVSRTAAQSINAVLSLCLTAMLFFAVTPCFGSGITLSYDAGDGCSDSVTNAAFSGPLPLMFSTSCVGDTLGASTTVAAEASLTVLKLYLDSAGTTIEPQRFAQVRVTDTITVTGGSGSGTLIWNWALDGSLAAGDGFYSQVYLDNLGGAAFADFRACGDNVQFGSSICYFDAAPNPPGGLRFAQPHESVNETRSISVPFVFGVPLTVDWRLHIVIGSGCISGNSCNTAQSGSGTVDFFNTVNTARVQPLQVLDSAGNQVSGASALSDSGFQYAIARAACDVNSDGKIDITDIQAITLARNTTAAQGDPRDVDGDGKITVLDARQCTLKCTNARCAP
jgi:Dockerin type I domain